MRIYIRTSKVLLIIAHGFKFVQRKEDIFGTFVCANYLHTHAKRKVEIPPTIILPLYIGRKFFPILPTADIDLFRPMAIVYVKELFLSICLSQFFVILNY